MPTVEGAGVPLSYVERGGGPAILLVHGMASDAAALAPVAETLAAGARVVTYDRRGYGASGAPQPYVGTTVEEQAQDAAALLRALDAAPAVVAGEGFGALVALDLMKRHAGLLRGAVLANPPLFMLVPEATEGLATQRAALEKALREGGPEAAIAVWRGEQADADADAGALARAQASARGFFADYAGLASWPALRRELRSLATPAVVLTGASSPRSVTLAADRLAGLLPAARRDRDGDLAAAVRSVA